MLALGRVDTNSGVIADRLATLGIDVIARSVVGDHLGHLETRRAHGPATG